jgi:hypothetical protein
MIRTLLISFLIALLLASSLYADFRLVRTIPSPDGCGLGLRKITGMAERRTQVGAPYLFVTSQCDAYMARSFLHLVYPPTGGVAYGSEFTLQPPGCGGEGPHLSSGAYIDVSQYWVTDECGAIMQITWHPPTLSIGDSLLFEQIQEPTGAVLRNDTLFIVDRMTDALNLVDVDGTWLGGFSLPCCCGASGLAMHDGNLFVTMNSDTTRIFEITTAGAMVDTHYVDGLAGMNPQSIAFVGDELYLAGLGPTIKVFERLESHITPTAPGDSVTLDVVPGEVTITFDSIIDSGYVEALVYSTQPCVEFFTKYYEITTTSSLEYINEIAFTDSSLAEGSPVDYIRVFTRPSGGCGAWRDITTDFPEVLPTLKVNSRTRSEDDEFSVFVLGFDFRNQHDVVEEKYHDARDNIIAAEDSIPAHAFEDMLDYLAQSAAEFGAGHYATAAGLAGTVAEIAEVTTQIPHVYDPAEPGRNVAGRIIRRARTLAFSYRFYPVWLAGVGGTAPPGEAMLSVGPNPATGSVDIEFTSRGRTPVEIAVYSVKGRRVRTLYGGSPGDTPLTLKWDGNNSVGARVAAGMYFVVARQGERTTAAKIILQR